MNLTTEAANDLPDADDTPDRTSPHETAGPPMCGDTSSFPSHAELTRTLIETTRTATLATLTRSGHPYSSIAPYATLPGGAPLICVSDLAEHTHNLRVDRRSSLLIQAVDHGNVDPLSLARATLIGSFVPHDAAQAEIDTYLEAHPHARHYVDFDDFSWWRFETLNVRYIGGFGVMGWCGGSDYAAAAADPIIPHASPMIDHLNDDHAEACRDIAISLARCVHTDTATVSALDRYGLTLDVHNRPAAKHPCAIARVAFPAALDSADQVRAATVELVRRARSTESSTVDTN